MSSLKQNSRFRGKGYTSRLQTAIAIAAAVLIICGCGFAQLLNLDLAGELCDPDSVQPYNAPLAGVDFLSEGEVLVYTVCHSAGQLAQRNHHPEATDPNHIKGVVLDIPTGTVKQHFDWPTRGRGSMLRVTHSGQLLLKQDNLLETLRPDGTPNQILSLPKVSATDLTFVALSPAVDAFAVTLSSQAPGNKTVNGVAVLDSRNLQPLAQWHEDGDWWNLAASTTSAVRTVKGGATVQVRKLEDLKSVTLPWGSVWSGSPISTPPLFVSDSAFVFSASDSLFLFTGKGIQLREAHCAHPADTTTAPLSPLRTDRTAVSRDGEFAACVCLQFRNRELPGESYRFAPTAWVEVYSVPLLRQLDSISLGYVSSDGFDLALSPLGTQVVFIDRLRVRVFFVGTSSSRRKETVR